MYVKKHGAAEMFRHLRLLQIVIMRRDIYIDWLEMELLAHEGGRIHLRANGMPQMR